jgi:hypothetical protein
VIWEAALKGRPDWVIEVWNRMPALLEKNEFYPSLLLLISTKLKPLEQER